MSCAVNISALTSINITSEDVTKIKKMVNTIAIAAMTSFCINSTYEFGKAMLTPEATKASLVMSLGMFAMGTIGLIVNM